MLNDVLIASDIEVFVQHRETKEVISAEKYIKGSKDKPFVFDPENKYFCTSKDNVLAEFCIPPVYNRAQFLAYIQKSLSYVNSVLPKEYCTVAFPAFSLDPKWLQTKQAKIFGCEPDFNAYTLLKNEFPKPQDPNLRSAGQHLHFSYSDVAPYDPYVVKEHPERYQPDPQRVQIIRACDLFISIPGVLMEPPNKRKELYGKAGAYRPKPYGVEYRSPSNYYLSSNELTLWLYDAAESALQWLRDGNTIEGGLAATIQETINTSDAETAGYLIEEFKLKTA